jgi:peptidoglycan/xylan/chitin deacetylase (PgdA/CDA1 family)
MAHSFAATYLRPASCGAAAFIALAACGGPSSRTRGSASDAPSASATDTIALSNSAASAATTSGAGSPTDATSEPASATRVMLPVPPGDNNVVQPAGAPGGVTVLDWAGFTAAVSYTFDDANSSQIANYDAFATLGVRMTFYLQTGKADAKDPIWARALRDGHELGNHTQSHEQTDNGADTDAATAFIERNFGVTPYTMASPFGSDEYIPLAQTRFLLNRGVNNGLMGPMDDTDPFSLYCYIPDENAPAADFNAQVDSARSAKKWRTFLVHGFVGGSDGAYLPVAIEEFAAAVQYAKSLGDVWLDSVVNVGAYWRGQKAFAAAAPTVAGDQQTWTWTLPPHFPPGHILRITTTGGTPTQRGVPLAWNSHGYYEIDLDAGSLTVGP